MQFTINQCCRHLPVILAVTMLASCSEKFVTGSGLSGQKINSGTNSSKTLYMCSDFSGINFYVNKNMANGPQFFASSIIKGKGQANSSLFLSNDRKVFYPASPSLSSYFLDPSNKIKEPGSAGIDAIVSDLEGNYMAVKYEGELHDLIQRNGWISFTMHGTITGGTVRFSIPDGQIATSIELNRISGESKITHTGTVSLL